MVPTSLDRPLLNCLIIFLNYSGDVYGNSVDVSIAGYILDKINAKTDQLDLTFLESRQARAMLIQLIIFIFGTISVYHWSKKFILVE